MIDYCCIVSGPNVGVLSRVCFGSLFRTSDVSDVAFHILNKDASTEDMEIIANLMEGRNCKWYRILLSNTKGPDAYRTHTIHTPNWENVADNCDFALNYCGTNQWCVLAHFDMEYHKDLLSLCKSRLSQQVGMLGQHERFLLLNRVAYRQSAIKFLSIAGFYVIPAFPLPTHGQVQLRHKTDPRVTNDKIEVRGFDTGELLELELRSLGWTVDPLFDELREYITHFGGGGSHYSEPERTMHRERALKLIQERGY